MKINIIAAVARGNVIGKDNKLPWHIPGELKRFKEITMGHPIVMGRKTFESIGRPLPGRENVVLTRNKDYKQEGVTIYNSPIPLCYHFNDTDEELFIIGGEDIYKMFLLMADKLYLTQIDEYYEGDVFFPEVEWGDFKLIDTKTGEGEIRHRFVTYERKNND